MNREIVNNMSDEEFTKLMVDSFPEMFVNINKSCKETCMCWGFEIGRGWQWILYSMCLRIQFISKILGVTVVADQVKEKFGSLRFYYHELFDESKNYTEEETDIIYGIIESIVSRAEHDSENTCEVCGKYGTIKSINGWRRSVCDEHAQ